MCWPGGKRGKGKRPFDRNRDDDRTESGSRAGGGRRTTIARRAAKGSAAAMAGGGGAAPAGKVLRKQYNILSLEANNILRTRMTGRLRAFGAVIFNPPRRISRRPIIRDKCAGH